MATLTERLGLHPRTPLRFEFEGTRHGNQYRVGILDQTADPNGPRTALVHRDTKSLIDSIVGSLTTVDPQGSFRMTSSEPLFGTVLADDAGNLYLDALSMFRNLPIRTFSEKTKEMQRVFGDRVKKMYINSLSNEPSFPNSFYLNRLILNAVWLPAIIDSVIHKRGIMAESDEDFGARRVFAGLSSHVLNKVFHDPEVYAHRKSRVGVDDQYQYLNGGANEFVLSGMHPTAAAIRHGLTHPNPYGITYDVYKKMENTMRSLLNGSHTALLSNPENLEKMLNDREAMEQMRKAMGDASMLVAPIEAMTASKDWLRRRFAATYGDPKTDKEVKAELQGYLNPQDFEKLLRDRKALKTLCDRMKLDHAIRLPVERSAEKVADPRDEEFQRQAAAMALRGYSRLLANIATYSELQQIVDPKNIEFLLPEGANVGTTADDFKNKTIYVFSENGKIFAGSNSKENAGAPGIISSAEYPIVAFIDIRKFTDFIEEQGVESGGTQVLDLQDKLTEVMVEKGDAEVANWAGDAVVYLFKGKESPQRYMHATSEAYDALTAFNEQAAKVGDATFRIGTGGYVGRPVILRTERLVKKGDRSGRQYIGRALNIASRLTTTTNEELSRMLEMAENIKIGDEIRRKPESHVVKSLVLPDGSYHNTSNLVTQSVVDMLQKEVKMDGRQLYLIPEDADKLNSYYDPSTGKNAELPVDLGAPYVLQFHDPFGNEPILLLKMPHKAKLKGVKDEQQVYEVVPKQSILYSLYQRATART